MLGATTDEAYLPRLNLVLKAKSHLFTEHE